MNAACTPNWAAIRFVPGNRIILQSSVLLPTFARRAARGGASLCPHPFNSTLWSRAPYGSSQSWRALIFPPQAPNEKTPPRGPAARRGIVSPRRKRGSPSIRPTWGMLSSKGVAVGSIRDSGTRKLSTAPCPPRCRTSDNLVVFIGCPFTPERGQIAQEVCFVPKADIGQIIRSRRRRG